MRGDVDGKEKDGTLVAIDFKDAFRSVLFRWFRLILERLGVPMEFRNWFWALYKNLAITIVINGAKSGKIFVNRGMMEGHPPSMSCFVTAMIPLLIVLRRKLQGVRIHNGARRSIFAFADDLKLYLKEPQEIHQVFEIIQKFQTVSGLEMHMDPGRGKCQALPFGSHRVYNNWPNWITIKEVVNILGILYGNKKEVTLEQLNTDFVKKKVLRKLYAADGVRGTVLQKVQFANIYLLSKIWYVAQVFILDKGMLKEIDRQIHKFIFAGENERPVRALCYRPKEMGGLSLICVDNKSKTLLIKNMIKEKDENEQRGNLGLKIYGNMKDLERILNSGVNVKSLKDTYRYFLQDRIGTTDNPIPSRSEVRNPRICWKNSWKNWSKSRGISAELRYFGWSLIQDMVVVPSRHHRKDTSKDCPRLVYDEDLEEMVNCGKFGDLRHTLAECPMTREKFLEFKSVLETFMEKEITTEEILFISFSHFDKKKLNMGVWITINSLYYIYKHKESGCAEMLRIVKEDLYFHSMRERGFVPKKYFSDIFEILENWD